MGKIYVPDGVDGVCYVQSTDYLTILKTNNINQQNQAYRVYFDDYRVVPTTSSYQQNCDTFNTYTHDYWYRRDLPYLFLMLTILFLFFYCIFKLLLKPFIAVFRR